ncbi:hypothetical protein CPB97_007165 [Podila verticillata]|nr:hypothetical protein CPB97_007165 [Podila verticillata]
MGYVFPKVIAYDSEAVRRVLQAYITGQSTIDTHILSNNALRTCQDADPSSSKIQTLDQIPPFDAFKDVLLIVNFNTGEYHDSVIDLYLEVYRSCIMRIEPVENWIPWHEEYLWNDSARRSDCRIIGGSG